MKTHWFHRTAVIIACLGITAPRAALAAPPVAQPPMLAAADAPAPLVHDVMLHEGGTLYGKVLDASGTAMGGAAVSVHAGPKQFATLITDSNGAFRTANLQGGVYQISSPQGEGTYRLWAPNTAPPAAQRSATLVCGDIVRGQGGHRLIGWLTNPWVLTGLIATAIAVPIALNNNDDDSGS